MAGVFDNLYQTFRQGAQNLAAWRKVATTPQLRQEYVSNVVKPAVKKVTTPIKNDINQYVTFQKNLRQTTGSPMAALFPMRQPIKPLQNFQIPIPVGFNKPKLIGFNVPQIPKVTTIKPFAESPDITQLRTKIQTKQKLSPQEIQKAKEASLYQGMNFAMMSSPIKNVKTAPLLSPTTKSIPAQAQKGTPLLPPSIEDPVKRIITALKEAKPIRAGQEELYTQARAARIAEVKSIGQKIGGQKGYLAKLGALKGEMPKVQYESLAGKITPRETDQLFNTINTHQKLDEFEKITAGHGLGKMFGEFGGSVPTEGELKLLHKVFGSELVKELLDKRSILTKMADAGYQLINIPRSLMSTADMSAGLRQAIFLAPSHPKRFASAFAKQFKYFASEKSFQALNEEISTRPTYQLMKDSKLAITDLERTLANREERFMSNWAEKIPGVGKIVRASGRAYAGLLNKFRADVFDDLIKSAESQGIKTEVVAPKIAEFINTATGRGKLPGQLENAAVVLNGIFFSPRLMASRLNLLNPVYYAKLTPMVRKEAIKSLLAFASTWMGVVGLLSLNKDVVVTTDPRSADFMKLKIGNTRLDIGGGFQQYIRAAAQLISGKLVSSTSGRIMTLGEGYRPMTRWDILLRQLEYKESPIMSFVTDLLRGQTAIGEDINLQNLVINRFIPMVVQDTIDVAKENPNLLPLSAAAFFGAGLQTYGPKEGTAQYYYDRWSKMPPNEVMQEAAELQKKDKRILTDTIKIFTQKKLGITPDQEAYSQLGVENGERAKAIFKEMSKLKTPQEKMELVTKLKKGGVISDQVVKQIIYLLGHPELSKKQSFKLPTIIKPAYAAGGEDKITQILNVYEKIKSGKLISPIGAEDYRKQGELALRQNWEATVRKAGFKHEQLQEPQPDQEKATQDTDEIIDEIWGDQAENGKIILSKENAGRRTGKEVDIENHIDPETGRWSTDAPVKIDKDPFTGEDMKSMDRGLFRINNTTFFTWLRGKQERQWMYEAGIIDKPYLGWEGLTPDVRKELWDRVLDPTYNTKFAKLLYDKWGPEQWAVVKYGEVTLK